jgi:hypothetical protein
MEDLYEVRVFDNHPDDGITFTDVTRYEIQDNPGRILLWKKSKTEHFIVIPFSTTMCYEIKQTFRAPRIVDIAGLSVVSEVIRSADIAYEVEQVYNSDTVKYSPIIRTVKNRFTGKTDEIFASYEEFNEAIEKWVLEMNDDQ